MSKQDFISSFGTFLRRIYQRKSLSTQMSWSISIFSVVLLVVIGFSAYRIALEESQEVINGQMKHMADFLQVHNQTVKISKFDPKRHYGEADFFIDIVDSKALNTSGLTNGYLMPYSHSSSFTKTKTERGTLIIYTKAIGDKQIQISQLNHVRVSLAKELAINMLLPYLLFVPFGIFGLYKLIRRHLRPLYNLKQTFAKRHPLDLSEIYIHQLPTEITPAINELNYLFKRIEEAREQQQAFVANAAHELRTPLTAINLQIKLLSKVDQHTEVYDDNLNDLQLSVQRMTRLVDQLMKLAHQDKMAIDILEKIDVIGVLRSSMSQLDVRAKEKSIQIQCVMNTISGEANVFATQAILETIFINLLDNAVKYTNRLGQIIIKVYSASNQTIVEFHDTGPGIGQHDLSRVKQRFVRLENTQHQVVGSGLGLSIVDAALKLVDGELVFMPSDVLSGLNAKVIFTQI
ncbi:sensor histidine kinase [Acinetobacter nectaris]|uniref:sensor histidine kinase n=1 Tax=Acinetobacter nectaris TaxID=1219382 RepID=UPI001F414AA2